MTFTIMFGLFAVDANAGTKTITSNERGTFEGYDYEYWKDRGTGTMTLKGGATFSCSWSNINNILFRTGKKLGSSKVFQDYGKITINYDCDYKPNGNSYLAVYGWTENPLVEYYIIESYGTWNPSSGSQRKGSATIDGREYTICSNSRTGPSIIGDSSTFQQYWSVCNTKRTSGTISISEHFKAWEKLGMKMGKMYEVSMVVEGYQSSGSADMKKLDLTFGDNITPTPTKAPTNTPTKTPTNTPTKTNTPTNTPVKVSVDINGDGVVNMNDVVLLSKCFNTAKGDPKYIESRDLNSDGAINMKDVNMIAAKFNQRV